MRRKAGAKRGAGVWLVLHGPTSACPASCSHVNGGRGGRKGRVYLSCTPFARKRGRGVKGGDMPPSCAAPCLCINGARGAKGGYALSCAVPCLHALFVREWGRGGGSSW